MADVKKPAAKAVVNRMVKVMCPVTREVVWANAKRLGFSCTKCGQSGHQVVER